MDLYTTEYEIKSPNKVFNNLISTHDSEDKTQFTIKYTMDTIINKFIKVCLCK